MCCKVCKRSAVVVPLHRTNPTGQSDAGWMCSDCIEKSEPELHKNMIDDGSIKLMSDIQKAINEDSTFKCEGCKHILPKDYVIKTPNFCYMCDPHLTIEEILNS